MFNRLIKRLQPPPFDDPAIDIQAQNTFVILFATFLLTVLYLIYSFIAPPYWQIAIAIGAMVGEAGLWFLLRKKQVVLASTILTILLWILILLEVILYGGVRDSGFAAFTIIVAIASLTIGMRGSIAFAILTILAGLGMVIAEANGAMPPRVDVPTYSVLISYGITIAAVVALLYLAIRSISAAAQKAIANEKAQREINQQLDESRKQLEEKTDALEKRSLALEAVADLAKITSEANDETALLGEVAQLIPERLGFTHVGIYLMDTIGENAVLVASNSDAGQALMADQYQLKVARGELAFIASGTELLRYRAGSQTYRLNSPMPVTGVQSNISFPLIAGERLLGLLNIQASGHIDEEELRILHTFTDQLALSIQNIRLLAQLQERLRQISALAGQSVRQAWEAVGRGELIGYQYDRLRLLPSGDALPEETIQGLKKAKSVVHTTTGKGGRTRLIAPLILRDEVIGVLGYEDNDPAREWRPDEKTLLETVASQVSLALENSRLVTEAQQRAEREQVVSEIISRIANAIDMDTILQSTVKELGQLVGDSEIAVQLVTAKKQ